TKALMKANYSSERREAIGSLNRGKNLSPETIELMRKAALNREEMSAETRAKVSANSGSAQLFDISSVSGEEFKSPDNIMVTSVTLRTIPVVARFLGCGEKTIRRALSGNGIVKKTWRVSRLGKAK
ncbi:hypothetical protein EAH88_19360, partial [Rhodanobacter glycinis]